VVDVHRDAMASVVLSKLYKYTPLQSSYGVNNVCLVNGRPQTLNLVELIREFIKFRLEVIVRRTRFELRKAEERAHILEGYLIALDHLDEIIALIRASRTVEDARTGLMERFALSEIQATAILEMRLQKLTGLERDKVRKEYEEVQQTIERLKGILASEQLQREVAKEELAEIREKYGDKRRTEVTAEEGEISIEDLIADDQVVITISHLGYIKRTRVEEYKTQGRGGRGSKGSKTRDADFIEHLFTASNHNYLLFFTEQGRCFWLRVYEIPEASKTSTGRAIQNLIAIPKDDTIKAYIKIQDLTDQEFVESHYIVFCTKNGMVKKTLVEAFSRPRTNGINAITINEGDTLLEARLTNGQRELLLANRGGRAIRFPESTVRPMGRTAAGVKGFRLDDDKDAVVGMVSIDPQDPAFSILTIAENGMGKRSNFEDYRLTNRGGKGVRTMIVNEKTGAVVGIKAVLSTDDLMITNRSGIMIRIPVADIRIMGRATQGVRVIRLDDDDQIADVAVIRDDGSPDNAEENSHELTSGEEE
jgi:DNA gyrase subunit A